MLAWPQFELSPEVKCKPESNVSRTLTCLGSRQENGSIFRTSQGKTGGASFVTLYTNLYDFVINAMIQGTESTGEKPNDGK